MTKKIIFIADFFSEEIAGGGELNNDEAIAMLVSKGFIVEKYNSRNCNLDLIKQNNNSLFIIGNFVQLHSSCIFYLQENCKYIIYEHDHKYLRTRNPADYPEYLAPESEIVNKIFYEKAKAVFLQSIFHTNIILKNLPNINAVNLSGNLWSEEILNFLETLSKKEKQNFCAIMHSSNWHKNTNGALIYCQKNNLDYKLIEPCEYKIFLNKLSENKKLVFFPKTTETLSRIVVESRMIGMSVVTNDKVGATYEPWFKLKGIDLINEMRQRREDILNNILRNI
jgi:hypothetical protein